MNNIFLSTNLSVDPSITSTSTCINTLEDEEYSCSLIFKLDHYQKLALGPGDYVKIKLSDSLSQLKLKLN